MTTDEALDKALAALEGADEIDCDMRDAIAAIKQVRARPVTEESSVTQPAPVQGLPFGIGGGLVAIKTLLSRDPCVHANTAIEMIDAILNAPAADLIQAKGNT